MAISEGTVLRIVGSLLFPDSVIAQNVWNAVLTTAGPSSDEDDVVSDMADWIEAIYTPFIANIQEDIITTDLKVYEYDPVDEDFDEVGATTWSVTFTNTLDMLPHGVACIMHMRTTDPDVQGTKFIGGIGETTVDVSDLTGGLLTNMGLALVEWYTQFEGAATGATFTPAVWSPTNLLAFGSLSDGYVNAQVGYQRRRKPGVGI